MASDKQIKTLCSKYNEIAEIAKKLILKKYAY